MKYFSLLFLSFFVSFNLLAQLDTNDFVTTWKTNPFGSAVQRSIFINTDELLTYNFDVDWNNDGFFDTLGVTGDIVHTYSDTGLYTVRIRGNFPRIYFFNNYKIISIDQWGNIAFSDLTSAFSSCVNLRYAAADKPNLTNINSLSGMFADAALFNGNVGHWDVSTITNMSGMFLDGSFNQDLSNWDVSNVTDMRYMFDGSPFNQDLSSWDVSSVTRMDNMFNNCHSFNGDVSNWDVSSVINMSFMFYQAVNFNGNISNWDVSSVINMNSMLFTRGNFNQNLSKWDISSVTNMNNFLKGGTDAAGNRLGMSVFNYDSTLIAWQAKPHQMNVPFGALNLEYCLSDSARTLLIADGWNFSGDSKNCTITSIEETVTNNELSIFPNPTNGIVTIEFIENSSNQEIQILNALGQVIMSVAVIGEKFIQMDLSDFPKGLYYVKHNNRMSKLVLGE